MLTVLAGFVLPPLKREVPRRPPKPIRETCAYRWSRLVQHHPWPAAIAGALVLLVLLDPRARPAARVLRREQLRRGHHHPPGLRPAGRRVRTRVQRPVPPRRPGRRAPPTPPCCRASPTRSRPTPASSSSRRRQPNDPENPTAYRWFITPEHLAAGRGHHRARAPAARRGARRRRGGARQRGRRHRAGARHRRLLHTCSARGCRTSSWPCCCVSFLLMMVVFRSLLVPLKAVIMNLLSIGAAYGITVAVVQWGWLGDVTGLQPGPIETFAPDDVLRHRVRPVDGLRGVPPLSGSRRSTTAPATATSSVANGLATTARVISAAAAIMVFVFGSFVLENDRTFKLFGVGLASAIFLDATVVRMLLVPATMELLGDKNWWLPRWLDRILPHHQHRGHAPTTSATSTTTSPRPTASSSGRASSTVHGARLRRHGRRMAATDTSPDDAAAAAHPRAAGAGRRAGRGRAAGVPAGPGLQRHPGGRHRHRDPAGLRGRQPDHRAARRALRPRPPPAADGRC